MHDARFVTPEIPLPVVSRMALATSAVTVPVFGFGIRRGAEHFAQRRGLHHVRRGDYSVIIRPAFHDFLHISSPPTQIAPASCASRTLSPPAEPAARPLAQAVWQNAVPNYLVGMLIQNKCQFHVSLNFV